MAAQQTIRPDQDTTDRETFDRWFIDAQRTSNNPIWQALYAFHQTRNYDADECVRIASSCANQWINTDADYYTDNATVETGTKVDATSETVGQAIRDLLNHGYTITIGIA